ncbi:unnamed protein product (macronuclear) [Paramecium tetraurelia]|uniref:Uncharacterized protein n=1 Tax=Paramecium tetraurelia TaxID=5888 RepID=A0DPW0_PARTE|nr:uncharacterized protein GSPATT00002476001 [Paramecium tetraurelia]CAK85077.1 unnamed protein product [Paramecium tetraurelia]|eukprot:XP_001452474.1 hypothetical protein (macronuclear) [Paramecium tetraurelia strain d4-2]
MGILGQRQSWSKFQQFVFSQNEKLEQIMKYRRRYVSIRLQNFIASYKDKYRQQYYK